MVLVRMMRIFQDSAHIDVVGQLGHFLNVHEGLQIIGPRPFVTQ